jgi:hypothetical protein
MPNDDVDDDDDEFFDVWMNLAMVFKVSELINKLNATLAIPLPNK